MERHRQEEKLDLSKIRDYFVSKGYEVVRIALNSYDIQ